MHYSSQNQASLHPTEKFEFIIAIFKEYSTTEGYIEIHIHVLYQNGNLVSIKKLSANTFEVDGKMYAAAIFQYIVKKT